MDLDKLKSFIDSERDAFDEQVPSPELWDRIDEDLGKPKKFVPIRYLYYSFGAAAAAVILMAFFFWNSNSQQPALAELVEEENNEIELMTLSDVSSELAEVESYYVAEVNLRMDELKALDTTGEYLTEVEMLKEEFESLKKEMGRGADQEKIVQAMIQNYRLRLDILEEMLEELRRWQQSEKVNYEA